MLKSLIIDNRWASDICILLEHLAETLSITNDFFQLIICVPHIIEISFLWDYFIDLDICLSFLLQYWDRWRRAWHVYRDTIITIEAVLLISHFSIALGHLKVEILLSLVLLECHFKPFLRFVKIFHRPFCHFFEILLLSWLLNHACLRCKDFEIRHWNLLPNP